MNDIDWNGWHALMARNGWRAVRDIFGGIVQYEYRRDGAKPVHLEAAAFYEWASLMQTPPPF